MSGKPLLLPEVFSGESQNWTEWAEHFESVATVNKWDSDDDKLKWLKVRLTGKARTACWNCGKKGHIARKSWNRQKATGSGKLQTLGPATRGRIRKGPRTAGSYTVTVPTLSVSSVASFSVHGMIGSIPLELLVDTGAAVSLLSASACLETNQQHRGSHCAATMERKKVRGC